MGEASKDKRKPQRGRKKQDVFKSINFPSISRKTLEHSTVLMTWKQPSCFHKFMLAIYYLSKLSGDSNILFVINLMVLHIVKKYTLLHIGIFIKPLNVSMPYNILINKIEDIG